MKTPKFVVGDLAKTWFARKSEDRQEELRSSYDWATSIQPGDLVNCCDNWNRVVERVTHVFASVADDPEYGLGVEDLTTEEPKTDYVWHETIFHFADGRSHGDRGGCAAPPATVEDVKKYHPDCDDRGCPPVCS